MRSASPDVKWWDGEHYLPDAASRTLALAGRGAVHARTNRCYARMAVASSLRCATVRGAGHRRARGIRDDDNDILRAIRGASGCPAGPTAFSSASYGGGHASSPGTHRLVHRQLANGSSRARSVAAMAWAHAHPYQQYHPPASTTRSGQRPGARRAAGRRRGRDPVASWARMMYHREGRGWRGPGGRGDHRVDRAGRGGQ